MCARLLSVTSNGRLSYATNLDYFDFEINVVIHIAMRSLKKTASLTYFSESITEAQIAERMEALILVHPYLTYKNLVVFDYMNIVVVTMDGEV